MTERIRVDTGEWKVELRVVDLVGSSEVKAAVFLRPLILSPFFTVKTFTGEDAPLAARRYVRRVKEALES